MSNEIDYAGLEALEKAAVAEQAEDSWSRYEDALRIAAPALIAKAKEADELRGRVAYLKQNNREVGARIDDEVTRLRALLSDARDYVVLAAIIGHPSAADVELLDKIHEALK